jgi:hypothetical protein
VAFSPLTFEAVRSDAFPMLSSESTRAARGRAAGRVQRRERGGRSPRFSDGASLRRHPCLVESALSALGDAAADSRALLLDADAAARRHVNELTSC